MKETQSAASETEFSKAKINQALSKEQKIGYLRDMMRIRRFEQIALKYYNQGKMGGFLHLYSGQEAIAVGTVSLMGDQDEMITAYRDHGHALAVGMGMNECMAELFGKATGCSKGKGGSMHFFAPDKQYWGGHGIVGGQTPLGLGIAFAQKYRGIEGCCLCFLGDGAINQGVFHESLNLAALWELPVVYVIENNHYSMGTSVSRSSAYPEGKCLAARAEAYGIDWDQIEGWDFYQLRARVAPYLEAARKDGRPSVLQLDTYRHYGHSVADANAKKYRSPDEIDRYKNDFDPIDLWRQELLKEGVLTEEEAGQLDKEAKQEAADSAKFAEESEFPTVDDILTDVYWEVDEGTEAGRTGRHFFND